MAFIKTVDQLKEVVKINSSIPYSTVKPFLDSACDVWITRFLGQPLVDALHSSSLSDEYQNILGMIIKAEGVLAMWIGNAELSVRISDSGFTVERTDTLAPASDVKIAEVKESLCLRGFQYLDRALRYLEDNAEQFPEWSLSNYYVRRSKSYIKSARIFQDVGGVQIDYSLLRFEDMHPLMSQIELRYISELFGPELDTELRQLNSSDSPLKNALLDYARKFIANKTAELYSSESSKRNASKFDNFQYDAVIRPIYFDLQPAGNFYQEQASFYYGKVQQAYSDYLKSIGEAISGSALEWNNDDKKIFIDIG